VKGTGAPCSRWSGEPCEPNQLNSRLPEKGGLTGAEEGRCGAARLSSGRDLGRPRPV
jgi:hypothetical protein